MFKLTGTLLASVFVAMIVYGEPAPQAQAAGIQNQGAMTIDSRFAEAPAPAPEPIAPVQVAAVAEAAEIETWYLAVDRVNVRAGPSTGNPVVFKALRGQQVDVFEFLDNGWAHVRAEDGNEGYLAANFLTLNSAL
jgi:hypothetical protein